MTTSTMSGAIRNARYQSAAGSTSRAATPRRFAGGRAAVLLRTVIGRGGQSSGRGLDARPRLGSGGTVVRRVHGVLKLRELGLRRIDDRVVLDFGRQHRR